MLDRVKNLAQLMKDKKSGGEKFVLMLGAGASLSSGVRPTRTIMQEILEKYGKGSTGSIEERFDELWQEAGPNDRRLYLKQYLSCKPSKGYELLADIVKRGFIDVVLTFNFDRLMESALDDADFRDYKAVIRGETEIQVFSRLVEAREPRVKIVKLHGSLVSSDYFLFSKEEMLNYPPEIESLVRKITSGDIIICGYAFNDICVIRAFSDSRDDGSIYYVNPSGAADNIRGFLIARRSLDRVITQDEGRFDNFVELLHRELTSRPEEVAPDKEGKNPFKFLDHYREADKGWFFGRKKLTRKLLRKVRGDAVRVIHLYGPARVGKTSFVHAGLMAWLDPDKYDCIYLRCQPDIEDQLNAELTGRYSVSLQDEDWDTLWSKAKARTPKRIVIFLDQFERVVRSRFTSEPELIKFIQSKFIQSLIRSSNDRLMPVFISSDDKGYLKLLVKLKPDPQETEEIEPFSEKRLCKIIQHAAWKARVKLDPQTVERLGKMYSQTSDHPFTLTHVQTLCYYHVKGFDQGFADYRQLPNPGLAAALDSVTEDSSLVDLIADLPLEERTLIRSVMKVICDPNATIKSVIDFMRAHFSDLKGKETFPEAVRFLGGAR